MRHLPCRSRSPRRGGRGALLGFLLLPALAACGDGTPEEPSAARRERHAPARPAPSEAEKARFAFDRLATGILPRTAAFRIEDIHGLTLRFAIADLVALPEETIALLSDPALQERFLRPEVRDLNPVHAVLDVLGGISPKPTDLVRTWARPALERTDIQLRRRAARALASTGDPDAGEDLLRLLESGATDRETAPTAFEALARLGNPWLAQALVTAWRLGGPELWEAVPDLLLSAGGGSAAPPATASALAWWALLAEGAGPRATPTSPRTVQVGAWETARLWIDPAVVWNAGPSGPTDPVVSGPLAAARGDGAGTILAPRDASPVVPAIHLALSGRHTAAAARCRLADMGFAAAQRSVEADLAAARPGESDDPMLVRLARHCAWNRSRGIPPEETEAALGRIDAFLTALAEGGPAGTRTVLEVQSLLPILSRAGPEGTRRLLELLGALRPADAWAPLLDSAQDLLLATAPEALHEAVESLLAGGAEDARAARHMIQRTRDARYLPALERSLATAGPFEAEVRRLLWWIHSGPGVEPAAVAAFARRYAGWIQEAPDSVARRLATGLLDLGEEGERAFAQGLRGPRRALFLMGLSQWSRRVSRDTARALLEPVDDDTPTEERRTVWIAAFRTAPAEAAPDIEAAVRRLPVALASEAADVAEVVRHRAAR